MSCSSNPAITLAVYSHFFKYTESGMSERLAHDFVNAPGLAAEKTELGKSGQLVGTQADLQVVHNALSA
jgi:hypothetical protein